MNLLIVDGSNVVMRCAFGGDVPPADATRVATNMIERAARELEATHLVVALDCPGVPSWRKQLYPDYKAHRTVDTYPWIEAAAKEWMRRQWWVEAVNGYEADDIIATVALRAIKRNEMPPHPSPLPQGGEAEESTAAQQRRPTTVQVLSGDSDVVPLLAERIAVVKPENGGKFRPLTPAAVVEKYGLEPGRLPQLKALTGEAGDNVPGVSGIGPVRALALLNAHADLEGVIAAGQQKACKFSEKVAAAAEVARLSLKLVTLVRDVPVVPISPSGCRVNF